MKKRWRLPNVLAMIFLCIMPVFYLLMGSSILCRELVDGRDVVVCLVVLPLAVMLGYFLILRSRCRALVKVLLCILVMVVFFCGLIYFMFAGSFEILETAAGEEAISEYTTAERIHDVMPDVGDLGTPENVEYDYFYAHGSIFSWSSEVLICEYSPQDYQEQVSRLEEQFVFQQKQVSAHEYSLEPEVSVQGYHFRLLSFEDKTYRLDYPKYMVFVGTNDETCEIVWMYCEDADLDYIVSLEEHILNDCGWKYIR